MKPVRDEGVGCVSREMRVVKGSMHCWPEETSGLCLFLPALFNVPFAAAVMY